MRCAHFLFALACLSSSVHAGELPFQHKIEVYREKDGDAIAFVLRLEQPFLAEEFEKSNYLRLHTLDRQAYLIYPKETKFHQKHAEFYGRLRGTDKAKVRLSYEVVTETLKGSGKVDLRQADLEISIPAKPGGPRNIFVEWANHQNRHFLHLLRHYPEESFFQYALMQSKDRYGVTPPAFEGAGVTAAELEASLYDAFTGSRAIQEALQRQAFQSGFAVGDQVIHVSELPPTRTDSPPYEKLLAEQAAKKKQPRPHDVARLVPRDQYFLHFRSLRAANELQDLITDWGTSILRLFTLHAVDYRFRENFEEQICLYREPLLGLFADGVASELAITGSDTFFLEGTDVTLIFRVKQPEIFRKKADEWLEKARKKHPALIERQFNYRGHQVEARYTEDRQVSSFVARHKDFVIYSNSHRGVREVLDAATGKSPSLFESLDYRYFTTLLPPASDANTAYVFASEGFFKRLTAAPAKISEKRRLLCFNNQVMLNNAALMYRMENGRSPGSLTDLYEGKFVDRGKALCPHGGVYSWDARQETCTCTAHNRLRYLTPNSELKVLKVSTGERDEYARYKKRFEDFWQAAIDPVAARITVGPKLKVELCVLPLSANSIYQGLRGFVKGKPIAVNPAGIAKSAVVSVTAVRGNKAIGEFLRSIPGIADALKEDPTLTDLNWLGHQLAVHYCDGDQILELDPARLRELSFFGFKVPAMQQAWIGAGLIATQVPTYFTIDVEDVDKAARLLDMLARKIQLKKEMLLTLPATFDAYRLPDYKKHAHYVVNLQVHVFKMRLHVALVGKQLVATTKADILKEAIDAADNPPAAGTVPAQLMLRVNVRALKRLQENFQLSWSEKSRLACHRNTMSIHNLIKLYDAPIQDVPKLAQAIYGVRYFCPDNGSYVYDAKRDQVLCNVHGNRLDSRQLLQLSPKSSFAQFIEHLDEIRAGLRFGDEALFATLEIDRRVRQEK